MDKNKLYDDLLDGFIRYQYRLENPMPAPDESFERMLQQYRHDHIFHSKVNSMASGVMCILDKHLD
jgi:hypothetical protein